VKLLPENSPWPRLLVWPLGLVGLAGVLLARLFPDLLYRWAHCPLHDTTGIPCFTCGGTRGLVALSEGRWIDSVTVNPLLFFLFLVSGLWGVAAVAATFHPGWRRSLVLTSGEKKAARWLAALLITANWIYLVVRF